MEACCFDTKSKDRNCSPASVQFVRDVPGPYEENYTTPLALSFQPNENKNVTFKKTHLTYRNK